MEIILRLEEEKDCRAVDEVTREAFWNVHQPGCDEHLLIHKLRGEREFVKDLDFVAVFDNRIVGNIVYVQSKIRDVDGVEYTVLTFGPVSVLPEYQHKGIGSKLIRHTMQLSREMGYRAILIYGEPEYYKRFGFIESIKYGITNKDGKYPAALLVLELYEGALDGINGVFDEGDIYQVDRAELESFDKAFPVKEMLSGTRSQLRFDEMVGKYL